MRPLLHQYARHPKEICHKLDERVPKTDHSSRKKRKNEMFRAMVSSVMKAGTLSSHEKVTLMTFVLY